MKPYPGKIVIYRWRPGQIRAGQTESGAMVTKVNADGTTNLTVYPDGSADPIFQRNVPAITFEVQSHCWSLPPMDDELKARIDQLETELLQLQEQRFARAS